MFYSCQNDTWEEQREAMFARRCRFSLMTLKILMSLKSLRTLKSLRGLCPSLQQKPPSAYYADGWRVGMSGFVLYGEACGSSAAPARIVVPSLVLLGGVGSLMTLTTLMSLTSLRTLKLLSGALPSLVKKNRRPHITRTEGVLECPVSCCTARHVVLLLRLRVLSCRALFCSAV